MRTLRHGLLLVVAAFAAAVARPAMAAARDSFVFEQAGKHVKVWYYAPTGLTADAPVVIVMHGVGRNGEDYLNDWAGAAEERHFLLVVPEFSKAEFPGETGYNLGNTVDGAGRALPRAEWSFAMIEPIFDAMLARSGHRSATYYLYGHSAGAQFVQRFLYFVPQARVARAVAANAGWYMLPDLTVAFPYGLKGTPVSESDLRVALGRSFTVLLGESDTDPKAKSLRHTPEAETQGAYRFARGQYFFRYAQTAATARQVPFGWSLSTAPGVAHYDRALTTFAAQCLLPAPLSTHKP